MTPACMTEPEMVLWSAANDVLPANHNRVVTPCQDCPLSFAVEMRALDCCDGTPQAVGRPHKEDTPRRAQWRVAQRARTARRRAARMAVA